MNYFWTNTIWFVLLGLITIAQLVYILFQAQDRKMMFTLFLSISGMAYLIEVSLFGIFRSYDYYPMIFHHISQLDDGLMGNVISQFSIGASALLIAEKKLKYYWYFIIALLYGAIEELFLKLGIYKQYWYRTWMTVLGFLIIFIVVKLAYNRITKGKPGKILQYFCVYFAVVIPHIFLCSWPFRLFQILSFSEKILPDPIVSSMLLFGANNFILTNVAILAYWRNFKWWVNGLIAIGFYGVYIAAYQLHYIDSKNIWILLLFATLQIFGMYLFVRVFAKRYNIRVKQTLSRA